MTSRITIERPDGRVLRVDRPDFSQCTSVDDFLALRSAMGERIIDIELQIDLYEAGCLDRSDPSWLPRARAALKWAKLYRDEVQNLQGRWVERDKAAKQQAFKQDEREALVQILKALLPRNDYIALMRAAEKLAKSEDSHTDDKYVALEESGLA